MSAKTRPDFTIAADSLDCPDVRALIDLHLARAPRSSPVRTIPALSAEQLAQSDLSFFTARLDGALAAIGALREINAAKGEIKSMRTADAYLGKGAGSAILSHLLGLARSRRYRWVGLETGRASAYLAAQRLYQKHGFRECPPYNDYPIDDFVMCMGLEIG